ncbi:hypothetical protein G114_15146 [Aeromonas diversa CDC 2478-85]|uniref:Uncharacterized protein n=1 Tax=Aeromonas diversa CDC 2478-85 TaxID=1268237 RepID=N9TY78_9GAMM|nr:hypothetical protein G114_15146 [Aeromonas diversa CDC 2478-85]
MGQSQASFVALQQMHLIVAHRHTEWRLLPAFGEELTQGPGVEQGAREQMGPHLRALLQQADRAVGGLLFEGDGGRKASWACSDHYHIEFHYVAFHLAPAPELS